MAAGLTSLASLACWWAFAGYYNGVFRKSMEGKAGRIENEAEQLENEAD